jgi:hypothetical protein
LLTFIQTSEVQEEGKKEMEGKKERQKYSAMRLLTAYNHSRLY